MSEFKISRKVLHKESRETIDELHDKTMNDFTKYYDTLPEKEKKLDKLIKDRAKLKNKNNYVKLQELNTKIDKLDTEISNIKSKDDMVDYLFKVYDFLKNNENEDEDEDEEDKPPNLSELERNKGINKFVKKRSHRSNGTKYNEFLKVCYNKHDSSTQLSQQNTLLCKECNNIQVVDLRNNFLVCENCGLTETNYYYNQIEWSIYENHEPSQMFKYKRKNHFKELITQLRANEYTTIPEDLLDKIRVELKKERITDPEKITYNKIREYIRKLNYNKYYEHIPYIIKIITNSNDFNIDKTLENKLYDMFDQVQEPFEKYKPKDRTNFLSYSFTLYKFCQLLGRYDLLKFFPLLKDRQLLFEQEHIWSNICKELNWEYIKN